jgi:predicted ATPase/class 3 adenylate cyclase
MPTNPRLPTGTVTFLFTDIEGSTRLWEAHPDAMRDALVAHDAIFREIVPQQTGVIFKTVGDAICAAFERPDDALRAAIESQRRLATHPWPQDIGELRVRMGIHTGMAQERDDDYFGRTVNRVARFMSIAHGGQILVSGATAALLRLAPVDGVSLRDLGTHRLKDLSEPEPAFQVLAAGLATAFPGLTSLDAHPNNLPSQTSTFVGRLAELDALRAALDSHRLVTIAGPGGMGKTRLSLQIAAEVVQNFADGVWFVEFAAVDDPALIAQTVVSVLRVREVAHERLADTLTHALERKALLLVFDNSEHLLAEIAALTKALLAHCPLLRVLVTSREPLHLDGEHVLRLQPLDVTSSADLTDGASLFLERARSAQPDLQLSPSDAALVDGICRRVEGIPLAIELAAARVATLSLTELDARLEQRFRILTSRDGTKALRHRALWETIDWSYRLLDDEERHFAAELATFNGSFSLDACEAVLPHGFATLDLLDSMVAKSIVGVQAGPLGYRYRIYDVIREYLSEQLGAAPYLSQRHFDFYANLAAEARDQGSPERQGAWLDRIGLEIADVRGALRWSLQHCSPPGLQMLFDICRYWDVRNHAAEGLEWARRGLALPDIPPSLRASLLRRAATFAAQRLEHADANVFIKACLEAYESLGDLVGSGEALLDLAVIAHRMGDEGTAADNYWLALEKLRAGGDARGEARALINLTLLAFNNADFAAAEGFLDKAALLAQHIGDAHISAHVTGFRASLEYRRGNLDASLALNREALEIRRTLDNRFGIAEILTRMAAIFAARSELSEAHDAARESFVIALEIDSPPLLIDGFEAFCEIALKERRYEDAARLLGHARFLGARHQYQPGGLRDANAIERELREALGDRYEAIAESSESRWREDAARLTAGLAATVHE